MKIQKFTFNYFSENTYLLYDETGECAIIDPGCCNREEEIKLKGFIESNNLTPVLLLNTHCHIDHILGNAFVSDTYKLELQIHKEDLFVLNAGTLIADQYRIPYHTSPQPGNYLEEGEIINLWKYKLRHSVYPRPLTRKHKFYKPPRKIGTQWGCFVSGKYRKN